MKVINNSNSLHISKYNGAISTQYASGYNQSDKNIGMASSAKHTRINNMLDDYERTKTFNQELLRNIGSPKGPIFTRAANSYNSYQENEVRSEWEQVSIYDLFLFYKHELLKNYYINHNLNHTIT